MNDDSASVHTSPVFLRSRCRKPHLSLMRTTLVLLMSATTLLATAQVQPASPHDGHEIMSDFNRTQLYDDINRNFPSQKAVEIFPWKAGVLPQACWHEAPLFQPTLSHNDFEVCDIHFGDCRKDPWVVCRHKKAEESWYQIAKVRFDVKIHV